MTSWPLVALQELGEWQGGSTPSKRNPGYWRDGTIPWLSPKDMGSDVARATRDHITESALATTAIRLVPANSVAVVVRSGILEHTLPVAVVPFATTLNQDIKALAPRPDVDPRWVAWGLRAAERHLLSTAGKAGTTVASLDTRRLMAHRLPLPNLEEQHRIVAFIEGQVSRLDAANNTLLRCDRRGESLLSGALMNLFAATGGAQLVLGDVARWGSGGTPRAGTPAYYEDGTIPWVNSGDLKDGHIAEVPKSITEEGLATSSAKWVPADSVMVAMYGATIGRTAINDIPVTTNQAVAFAVAKRDVIRSDYLFWYLRSQRQRLAAAGQGGAQPNISQTILKSWPIVVPPLAEQDRVVVAATALESQISHMQEEARRQGTRSRHMRVAILQQAFGAETLRPNWTEEVNHE